MTLNCINLTEAPLLEKLDHPFIAILSRYTLTWYNSNCLGLIYGSNRSIWDNEVFVLLFLFHYQVLFNLARIINVC